MTGGEASTDRILPFKENPRYWQYKGKPVLLLGGSKDDNLFQIPDLREHLDEMVAVGANYIRNTMSDRPGRGFEINAFHRLPDGQFDLERWNEEYWNRFENMLRWTAEREIFVQIELWDCWDMYADGWEVIPWNPGNNINYTHENTRLAAEYAPPGYARGTSFGRPIDFFLTVPALHDDRLVLSYQQRFIDKMLSYSLAYDHVLYCISNEIHPQYPPEWGWYWADYLRTRASEADRQIEVTEMYWMLDLKADQHRSSLDQPERFSFFEASQNSAILDPEEHWKNLHYIYRSLADHPRPINNTKIYGSDEGPDWAGSTVNAAEKFWRNIMGGSAASRFHRPDAGLGLSEPARIQIKSLRILTAAMNVFGCQPRNDLLGDRAPNEAYCLAEAGRQYAVYFPDGGGVTLDLSGAEGVPQVRWLNIREGTWLEPVVRKLDDRLNLKTPGDGPWAALVVLTRPPDRG